MESVQTLEQCEKAMGDVGPEELREALLAIVREMRRAAAQQARAASGLVKACGVAEKKLEGGGLSNSL